MLHYASKSYIASISMPDDAHLRITTVSFLGNLRSEEISLASLGPAGAIDIFANMAVQNGRGFYLDPLGVVHDEDAFERLRSAVSGESSPL
mmetsp:Transcript_4168/g.11807  ORF Transcript_4168/g.11807 Transcript_4168/m.11807 type:complete len:91 (-) Transcript_4168:26-298(-)